MSIRKVAFIVYEGFNELDTFASLHIIGRAKRFLQDASSLDVTVLSLTQEPRSMYGVTLSQCGPLEVASLADAVIVGSGGTLRAIEDPRFMTRLQLDPTRQLIGAQCSGTLILAKLGFLRDQPACTDLNYRASVEAAGIRVLDQPFHAQANIATAGGCLAAPYLATWVLWQLLGPEIATNALSAVAPVGQPEYVHSVTKVVEQYSSRLV